MPKRNRPEQALHIAVAQFLNVALPPEWEWQTVENAGKRGPAAQAALKRTGNKPGFPDLVIIPPLEVEEYPTYPGSDFVGWKWAVIFIELKAPRGQVTVEQKRRHARLLTLGYDVAVCRSVEDVEQFLRNCNVPLRASTKSAAE